MPRTTNQMATTADYALTISDLAVAIVLLIRANVPGMIWSAPGLGKSAIVQQVAAALGMNLIDIRLLHFDPVDLRGIPYRALANISGPRHGPQEFTVYYNPKTNTWELPEGFHEQYETLWARPGIWPTEADGPTIIFLDELPSAPPMMQATGYQIVHDRRIGEHKLPDTVRVLAAGNRAEDRAVVHPMPTPLRSRFVHLDVREDFDSWFHWAVTGEPAMTALTIPYVDTMPDIGGPIAPEVAFYLRNNQGHLMDFDPNAAEMAYACPRTWEFTSNLVKIGLTGTTPVEMALLRGTIGAGKAMTFSAYMEMFRQLPDAKQVVANPRGVPVPTNASAMISLCGAVAAIAEPGVIDAVVDFAMRDDVRPEVGEFLIQTAIQYHPLSQFEPAYIRWEAYLTGLK